MSKTTIPTGGLADSAVSTVKIADDAVTAAKATGFGKIGQVITATKTSQFETTSTSYASSGLEATITPTSTSSKIFMIAATGAIHTSTTSAGGETLARFYKNHASISATAIGNDYCVAKSRQDSSYNQEAGGGGSPHYLDSPSTTEAITYTVYLRINTGTNGRLGQNNTATTITLMEVLA